MKIVLISYLNRSGSTFLVNQLSKMPQVCVCPEADILYELLLEYSDFKIKKHHIKKWKSLFELDYKFKTWKIPVDSIINLNIVGKTSYLLFLEILIAFQKVHFPNCNILFFKQNYLYKVFNKLTISYSDYKFYSLQLIRDPRGIYSSQKSTITPQTNKKMCMNPLQFIGEWNTYIEETKCLIIAFNHRAILFEDLIQNFENSMDLLIDFLSIEKPNKNCFNLKPTYTNWINKKTISIHPNINTPPNLSSITKWENTLTNIDLNIIKSKCINNNYYNLKETEDKSNIFILTCYLYFSFLRIKSMLIKYLRIQVFRLRFVI